MQTYSERSTEIALTASVAVQVLLGTAPGDAEFIPLLPRPASQQMWDEVRARWPGRGLRPVGILGLVGTTPKCAFKEELQLETDTVCRLAEAFLAYLNVLFQGSFSAHVEAAEIAELERMYQLSDTRQN